MDYEKRVYFQCLSGGELLENQGTPIGSSSIEMANGKAQIIAKKHKQDQPMQIVLYNQSFKGTYITIP